MKNVLIVDDEKLFLKSLSEGLSTNAADFNVLTANHGGKAVEILKSLPVDLVVTDLKMPVMDGFELLAYMNTNHPDIPAIVMTAFGTPAIENRLSPFFICRYIEKPFELSEIASAILNELTGSSEGHIVGITLPTFLQLIEMEKKTCTLTVKAKDDKIGHLFFKKGELLEAETSTLRGAAAAYDIVCWENAEIEINPNCKKKSKNIEISLSHILMEGFRLKDEKERRTESVSQDAMLDADNNITLDSSSQEQKPLLKQEDIMALEKHLQALKEVKGFKAAGIMHYTGEMLAHETADANIDLALVGATFNDIFRSAHEASKKIGLDACRETVISTPKGTVVMCCSGVDAKAHFHLIGVMAADGNQALMKMQMEKMVPAVMADLA